MIKGAGATAEGKPFILLGLSGGNMTRLMADEPIVIDAKEIDPRLPDVLVLLVGGRTEDDIARDIQGHLNRFRAAPEVASGG